MFESRKLRQAKQRLKSYIKASLGEVESPNKFTDEIKGEVVQYSKWASRRSKRERTPTTLDFTYYRASYYADKGLPAFAAAYLSLTPIKEWQRSAEILAHAYENRSSQISDMAHTLQPDAPLIPRSYQDHSTAQSLNALSQTGRRTPPAPNWAA